jgi:hypothetical protein
MKLMKVLGSPMRSPSNSILFRGVIYQALTETAPAAPEKRNLKRFLTTAKRQFLQLIEKDGAAARLQQEASQAYPSVPKAKAYWTSRALDIKDINNFVKKYNLTGDKEKFLLDKVREVVFGKPVDQVWGGLQRYLDAAYVAQRREKARAPVYSAGLPKEIVEKLFPKPYAFEVAPDGRLVKEFEIFGNEKKTIEKKRNAMAQLLEKWRTLVDTLERDLESSDPERQLLALVTSIIVNTGIRPGSGGESKLKDEKGNIIRDEDGNPIRVPTFGATGLQAEHVDFVRDTFAVIAFPGKAGTRNIAELTDPMLVRALNDYVRASDGGSDGPIFATPEGYPVSPKRVNSYIRKLLGPGVSASDFRKLKATRTFYESLKHREHELAYNLRALKLRAGGDMQARVVQTILDHLMEAAEHAQQQISHTNLETTINYYISPRVVLSYLVNAGIDRSLAAVIGDGKDLRIRFDPMDFYETITEQRRQRAASVKRIAKTTFYYGDNFVDFDVDDTIEELSAEATIED